MSRSSSFASSMRSARFATPRPLAASCNGLCRHQRDQRFVCFAARLAESHLAIPAFAAHRFADGERATDESAIQLRRELLVATLHPRNQRLPQPHRAKRALKRAEVRSKWIASTCASFRHANPRRRSHDKDHATQADDVHTSDAIAWSLAGLLRRLRLTKRNTGRRPGSGSRREQNPTPTPTPNPNPTPNPTPNPNPNPFPNPNPNPFQFPFRSSLSQPSMIAWNARITRQAPGERATNMK